MTRKSEQVSPRVAELLTMLTTMRPAGSDAESAFCNRYLRPLGTIPDEYGNHWLTVNMADGTASPILWSSHTDTVHKRSGVQKIVYGDGIVTTVKQNCLGADCTVGVWLMVNMIRAGIPGTYVFHKDEEVGGLGSSYIASETPERLAGIKFAIAFDRKGLNEIITHQGGERCASEAFADSLSDALAPLPYSSSDGGTFTDTANYSGLVSECCNIAVGYYGQHTAAERLDVRHALALLRRMLAADWTALVAERDHTAAPDYDYDYDYGDNVVYPWRDESNDVSELLDYVRRYPQDVADYLAMQLVTPDEIDSLLWKQAKGYKGS
jgi:hypothetical protein